MYATDNSSSIADVMTTAADQFECDSLDGDSRQVVHLYRHRPVVKNSEPI